MTDGKQRTRATGSREDPEVALAAVEEKFRTLGTAGTTRTLRQRWSPLDARYLVCLEM